MTTFDEAWKRKGYFYGEDALEQVRLGWEMRGDAESTERERLLARAVAAETVLDNLCELHPTTNAIDLGRLCREVTDARSDRARLRDLAGRLLASLRAAPLRYGSESYKTFPSDEELLREAEKELR